MQRGQIPRADEAYVFDKTPTLYLPVVSNGNVQRKIKIYFNILIFFWTAKKSGNGKIEGDSLHRLY